MRIETGNIALASQYAVRRTVEVQETARAWGQVPTSLPIRLNIPRLPTAPEPTVNDSIASRGPGRLPANAMEAFERAMALAPAPPPTILPSAPPPPKTVDEVAEDAASSQSVTALILQRLFGIEVDGAEKVQEAAAEGAENAAETQEAVSEAQQAPRQGWGVEYRRLERRTEQERVEFSAEGEVTTQDGKTIAARAAYAREYTEVQESEFYFQAGDPPTDPLVVDHRPGGAVLTDSRTSFDLDGRGKLDSLPSVRDGAYLAFDRNQDRVVNDGGELFGPRSGDGFADLRALDLDGNSWIDESDPAWSRLGLWSGGSSAFTSLEESGIGAFYLGSAPTPFTERGASSVLGYSRASSAYLFESGGISTYRQIDIVA